MTGESFAAYGIHGINNYRGGQQKVPCPRCSRDRKKKSDRCLSVNVNEGVWNCHHCGWQGSLKKARKIVALPPIKGVDASEGVEAPVAAFFKQRGISEAVIAQMHISQMVTSFGEERVKAIIFPYYYDGQVVNIKYRTSDKRFKQVYGGSKVLYNHDILRSGIEDLIITEGEMDALSYMQAGMANVVSVPDGAPNAEAENVDNKMRFIDDFYDDLSSVKRIYLAVDNDANGRRLRAELARRLGKLRCYIVEYPDGCKDANDVLVNHGVDALKQTIATASPYPIEGIHTIIEFGENLDDIYDNGYPTLHTTGYEKFDSLLRFQPGQLTVITGIPGHGKSVFLENIANRLASRHNWRFAWYTPEHSSASHAQRLIENHIGKPLLPNYHGRMTREEYLQGKIFLSDHHFYIVPDTETYSVDDVLGRAEYLVGKFGVKALVLDAYNQLEHSIGKGETETIYVSHFLNRLKFFAREHDVHLFLVAHPTKMQKASAGRTDEANANRYEVPTLYSISGSAHFNNITDNGFTVYRDIDHSGVTRGTKVYVQKVKFDWQGGIGYSTFQYEQSCKRFEEVKR